MELQSAEGFAEIEHRKAIELGLKNSLVVEQICSSSIPTAELLNFRLVNRIFHCEATKRLRSISHKYVDLQEESSINKFLALMRARILPEESNSYPFTSFKLDLRNSIQSFEQFLHETGQHVRRLKFTSFAGMNASEYQLEQKLILLVRRSPNIVEIDLRTSTPVYISNDALSSLPTTFPRLRVIGLDHVDSEPVTQPGTVSLLSVLISRATRLDQVRYVKIRNNFQEICGHGVSAFRALGQNHSQCMPSVNECQLIVLRSQMLQEISDLTLRIVNLNATVVLDTVTPLAVPDLARTLSLFLTTLTSCLRTLRLVLFLRSNPNDPSPSSVTFKMPCRLAALTDCSLMFLASGLQSHLTTVFFPVSPDQFPVLRKLFLQSFICGPTSGVNFEDTPLPSVQELKVVWASLLDSNPWNRILPNLTSISLNSYRMIHGAQNLSYILRHFPALIRLEIGLNFNQEAKLDCWDILTGGAPRPLSREALPYGDLEAVLEQEEPVDGVYGTSSLGNLKSLKTLICRPGCRSNLDAILYMTKIGRLAPLEQLILYSVTEDFNMQVDEKNVYQSTLAMVHAKVVLADPNT